MNTILPDEPITREVSEAWNRRKRDAEIEQLNRAIHLDQMAVLRQSLEERDQRLEELTRKVELLESVLNRLPTLAAQPALRLPSIPRRWAVK